MARLNPTSRLHHTRRRRGEPRSGTPTSARRLRALPAVLGLCVFLSACGLASRAGAGAVTVIVTRDFGAQPIAKTVAHTTSSSETLAQLAQRSFPLRLGADGSIQSLDGLTGRWFTSINGIGVSTLPAKTTVHAGDRVWLDLHDPSVARFVPAVVGAFPEPFVHGYGGRRFPTTIGCAPDVGAACTRVTSALDAAGVPVSSQVIGAGSGQDTLTVEVATWSGLRGQIVASLVDQGPGASGVYARFTGSGGELLELLNSSGRVVRTLGAGAGLIAATSDSQSEPTWLITGTDVAGVTAAADALSAGGLRDHLAVVLDRSARHSLPVPAP